MFFYCKLINIVKIKKYYYVYCNYLINNYFSFINLAMKMGKSVYIVAFSLLGVLLLCENKKGLLPAKSVPIPVHACDSIE